MVSTLCGGNHEVAPEIAETSATLQRSHLDMDSLLRRGGVAAKKQMGTVARSRLVGCVSQITGGNLPSQQWESFT